MAYGGYGRGQKSKGGSYPSSAPYSPKGGKGRGSSKGYSVDWDSNYQKGGKNHQGSGAKHPVVPQDKHLFKRQVRAYPGADGKSMMMTCGCRSDAEVLSSEGISWSGTHLNCEWLSGRLMQAASFLGANATEGSKAIGNFMPDVSQLDEDSVRKFSKTGMVSYVQFLQGTEGPWRCKRAGAVGGRLREAFLIMFSFCVPAESFWICSSTPHFFYSASRLTVSCKKNTLASTLNSYLRLLQKELSVRIHFKQKSRAGRAPGIGQLPSTC
jgi:hypothetical protein